jgi:hypothetical protein
VGYPVIPGISGGAGVRSAGGTIGSPGGIALNAIVPESEVITPEPATWPLLTLGLLLGSPALVLHRRNRAHLNARK